MQNSDQTIKSMRWEIPGDSTSGTIRIMTGTKAFASELAQFLYSRRISCVSEAKTPLTRGVSEPNVKVGATSSDAAMELCHYLVTVGRVATEAQIKEWGFELPPSPPAIATIRISARPGTLEW